MLFQNEDMDEKNFFSISAHFITTPYRNINYLSCRCCKCIHCSSYDTILFHENKGIVCNNQRKCYNCGKHKTITSYFVPSHMKSCLDYDDQCINGNKLIKHILINIFVFLMTVLMIPVQALNLVLYMTYILTKSSIGKIYEHPVLKDHPLIQHHDNFLCEYENKIIKYINFLLYQVYGSNMSHGYDFLLFLFFIFTRSRDYLIGLIIVLILLNRINRVIIFISLSIRGIPGVILHVLMTMCDLLITCFNECVIHRIINKCGHQIVCIRTPGTKTKILLIQNITVRFLILKILFIVPHTIYQMFMGMIQMLLSLFYCIVSH